MAANSKSLSSPEKIDQSLSERHESLMVAFQIRATRLKKTKSIFFFFFCSEGGPGASEATMCVISFLPYTELILAMMIKEEVLYGWKTWSWNTWILVLSLSLRMSSWLGPSLILIYKLKMGATQALPPLLPPLFSYYTRLP